MIPKSRDDGPRLLIILFVFVGLFAIEFGAVFGQESIVERFQESQAAKNTPKRFERVSDTATGVDFVSRLLPEHPYAYLYHSGMTCSGIAAGDIDLDGRPDLFLANGPGPNALYLQTGEAIHFEDVTKESGVGLDGDDDWAAGVALADVDNDGDLDVYICNYETPNRLFINIGPAEGKKVRFEEVAALAGVNVVDASHAAAFCDYDNDGDLDFYLLTNRVEDPRGALDKLPVVFERPGVPKLLPGFERYHDIWIVDEDNWGVEPTGRSDYLFRNDGVDSDGNVRFTDVTSSAGMAGRGDGLSCIWWDADLDGDCDLYVCDDFISPDRFYVNNGDGTFTNQIAEAMPHTTWFSMGSDFGDFDNDGDFDLLVADMSATSHYKSKVTMGIMGGIAQQRANTSNPPQYMRNALFVNEGQLVFREAAYLAGLSSSDWTWAVKMNDFDSDGWLDIFLTNGVPREMNHSDMVITREMLAGKHMWEFFKDGKMRKEQNLAFRNQGGLGFTDASSQWGLDHLGASYGAACADFDSDGDLDLAVMNLEENVSIYRNNTSTGSFATIQLIGTTSNRFGIGATVRIESGDKKWIRQLMPCAGYHSYDQPILHFGLGDIDKIDRVIVQWPGGETQIVTDVQLNRRLVITQQVDGKQDLPMLDPVQEEKNRSCFAQSYAIADLWHQENEFDDFALQPLLPHKLSSEGPCMAWADVNGDGHKDVFVGGSAGMAAQLRLGTGDGNFRVSDNPEFLVDSVGEDTAAQFGDFDRDGDLDLLVGRGSYEFKEGAIELRNILYLNDGSGRMEKAGSNYIPASATNSGTLAACDFDKDGDLDVFVGTRVLHGQYPLSGHSELWINNNARFVDRAEKLAPDLRDAGMVTDAVWADIDGDGWLDLLVAREWGTIALYINKNGQLILQNDNKELSKRTGWWKAIDTGDIDGDGDIDLLATNVGLNTKYKSTLKKPMTVYYGAFDESGDKHIIEVKQEGEVCYPERGRSCSSNAMPFIAEKFESFHEFGLASLTDIYGDEKLNAAERFEANTFEHGVFVNDGLGAFEFKPLEKIVQIAPSGAAKLADLDADGDLDIAMGQNFYGPQSETGRYDGGLGQILINNGRGELQPIPPVSSGFVIREAVTAIEVLDTNNDGQLDVAVATNDGPLRIFVNQTKTSK